MIFPNRKIPYNYTSADDHQIIRHLFGLKFFKTLQALEPQKDTGRSARLLFRVMGDLFIIQRNPFLFQELVEHPGLRKNLYARFSEDLNAIGSNAKQEEVYELLDQCRAKLKSTFKRIHHFNFLKLRFLKHLTPVIGRTNIYFDAFNICAHSTDATDWRMHVPIAVVRPTKETHVPKIVRKINKLGLKIIPRGGGTGLTGGAVPLTPSCVMVNTEKLNRISDIQYIKDADGKEMATLKLGAGVITQNAIDFADRNGFIFATDPTSAWACTIGGNLAENAGGKKAVLFGTAIDNVLSYQITAPDGKAYKVSRLDHPQRKIDPDDLLRFEIRNDKTDVVRRIDLPAREVRKQGLGKDITNKTLMGLWGIQKEGCDGIITSARFILYPKFRFKKTVCIEFFGNEMTQASQVIARMTHSFQDKKPALMALEHFDEEYIKAINYKTKTAIGDRIIAVLLVDVVSDNEGELNTGLTKIENLLEPFDKTGYKIACDNAESERFWQDRRRLGAIAAHTNAFKLNEDIVIPIDSLAAFAKWVDQCNIEEKKLNQIQIIDNIVSFLETAKPLADPQWMAKRVGQAKDLAFATKKKMQIASRDAIEAYIHAKNYLDGLLKSLYGYTSVIDQVRQVFETSKARLIVIATHMHAGDGNVHVNIPVLSNDQIMMQRAEFIAGKVMEKAVELNGVVSGEHGIGITKINHLDSERIQEFADYKNEVDPAGVMNPGKLLDPDVIHDVYTPSFNLMDLEAKILKHTSLSQLTQKVANCVRCGKCKITCPVFYPDENLYFHPRNKNIGIGSLIEALLYITQRTQSTTFKILTHFEQIADHCTLCRKCYLKCPVQIDTSQISIFQRNLLKENGFKKLPAATRFALGYLNSKSPAANFLYRRMLLRPGAFFQRQLYKVFPGRKIKIKPGRSSVLDILRTPVTRPHRDVLFNFLPGSQKNQAVLIEPPQPAEKTVFYFPGCGSERLFSRIAMSGIYLLLKHGIRIVLPPANLCCGYPFKANAKSTAHDKIQLENVIIFSQIRSMFQDLKFDACLVSCGTCLQSMEEIGLFNFFNCDIQDINQYLSSQNPDLNLNGSFIYHKPCHDSLNDSGMDLLQALCPAQEIKLSAHCCSEAGTMALSRPHIALSMLKRKQKNMNLLSQKELYPVLTNCPSCIQGIGRLDHGKRKVLHISEALAQAVGGKKWIKEFKILTADSEMVNF